MKTNDKNSLLKYEEFQNEDYGNRAKSFTKYARHWKWFVISIILCLVLAEVYLRTATPTYEVNAKILLENTTEDANPLRGIGLFNIKSNVDNEQEILNTSYLMELTVRKMEIYAQYYNIGSYKETELYGVDCPIAVRMPKNALNALTKRYDFKVEVRPNKTYVFTGTYDDTDYQVMASERDSQVVLPFGLIYFSPGIYKPTQTMLVGVSIENPSSVADRYLGSTNISLTSKTTTVINLSLKTNHIQKGIDFINTFIESYREEEIRDQNLMAENTSKYLDNLLASLGDELNDVEKRVESYKQNEGVTDISSEAQLYIQRTGQYEQRRLEVGTQLGIVKDLEEYINRNENHYQLLPSGIGLQSSNLNTLINEYNNLLLESKRLSRTATKNNQAMIDLTDRIDALFRSVQNSVANEKRNLMISQQDLTQKNRENLARIQSIPRQERAISSLSRQQNVKSQLYLLLLQRRDENYLNKAASAPKFKVISYPRSNGSPVAPKGNIILMMAFIGGLFLPVFTISIGDLMHNSVENKEELKLISSVPILSEIPKSRISGKIIIQENATDGFTEMFRLLRTNLMFVLNEPSKKVINIVSSVNGEGKTLLSINLAISLALLDKKVLVINLDIRKPKIEEYMGLDNNKGITQYLSGQLNRSKLVMPSGVHPNLWVVASGPVPPNPNELLAKPALDDLIAAYREQFDYIVVDTPPIGAVSDCLLLNRFADANLYIVRANYTPKKAIIEANGIFINQKLNNMYLVLNAIDMHKASNYSYGYGKRYGRGYGYYTPEQIKRKKQPKVVNA